MQPSRLSPRRLLVPVVAVVGLIIFVTVLNAAPSSDETTLLAARARSAFDKDLSAEALADFRQLEKISATPDAVSSARRGQHAALSALYRQEQHRLLLLPAHRALAANPDFALAWWNWTRACLAVGGADAVNSARSAIEKLAVLPDTTAELRTEIARASASPDTAPRLVNEVLVLLEPALPPADAADASLTPGQRDARALHNHFMSVWTETNRTHSVRYDEESDDSDAESAPAPLTPAERNHLHNTIRQAADLLARTRAQVEARLSAANAARDQLLQSLADGQIAALDLIAPFDTALAAYDPALHPRQLGQARQRLARLMADPAPEELVNLAQSAVEKLEFRSLAAADLQAARNAASPVLALLVERRDLVPPAADAPADAHAAHLERLDAFLARGWPLTRAETRAQVRALLALESPLSAASVLHASLALAPDGPAPEDALLLRAIQDRSDSFARTAESAAAAGDLTTALDAWREAARLAPGDPAAWRTLYRAARSAEGAELLALEAAGRLWQLDAITREEIFTAGSLALSLGQPDWAHVLLSRLPDGGTAHFDTQLLRVLYADRHLSGPPLNQEFDHLRRFFPEPGCLAALGKPRLFTDEIDLNWAPLKTLRDKIKAAPSRAPVAPAGVPVIPVLGDPMLARHDAAKRPGLLPVDTRATATREAFRRADEAEARRLLATDPIAAIVQWARASSTLGQPIQFTAFAPELAPVVIARPELLHALAALDPLIRDPFQRDLLHPLPAADRDLLFRQHYDAACARLKAGFATTNADAQKLAARDYFASLKAVGDLLRSTGNYTPLDLARGGLDHIPSSTQSIFHYLLVLPDNVESQAMLSQLSPATRAEIRTLATNQVASYNKKVARQYAQQLNLGGDYSNEIVNQALSAVGALPADHPDRIAVFTATPAERKREVLIRYAAPIKERAANRTVGELAITAAQNGTGSWADAEKAARRAGGDTYARYLASAPNVPLSQVQSALRSGGISANWFYRLQQANLAQSLQIEREARARAAEFQARTGGGRYDINQTVYNSRHDSTGAGYQSYEKAMRRELDRLYPTGR